MRFLKNVFAALFAQLSKFGRWLIGRDPIAVARQTVEDASESLGQYAGLIETKAREIETLQGEEASLSAKIRMALGKNDEAKATEFASSLATVRRKLEVALKAHENYKANYQKSVAGVKNAATVIASKERVVRELKNELRASNVDVQLAKLNGQLSTSSVDNILSGTNSFTQELQDKIDRNRGEARVAGDLLSEEDEYDKAVQNTRTNDILNEFRV